MLQRGQKLINSIAGNPTRRCLSSNSSCNYGGCTKVMSFGDGSHGAIGLPTSLTGLGTDAYEPICIPGLPSDIVGVSAGHYHSLVITSQGELWAWGRNHEAQLGHSLLASRLIETTLSVL